MTLISWLINSLIRTWSGIKSRLSFRYSSLWKVIAYAFHFLHDTLECSRPMLWCIFLRSTFTHLTMTQFCWNKSLSVHGHWLMISFVLCSTTHRRVYNLAIDVKQYRGRTAFTSWNTGLVRFVLISSLFIVYGISPRYWRCDQSSTRRLWGNGHRWQHFERTPKSAYIFIIYLSNGSI